MPTLLRRNREFVALWVGQSVSALGISVSSFAYPLVVLQATGSATRAGLIGSVLAGTSFFLRLPAGALVDRWNRKMILVVCEIVRAATVGSVAVALALGHFFFLQLLIVAFCDSACGVFFGPAESAAMRRVVHVDQIGEAVARNASRGDFAGVIGPSLGGLLFAASRALPFFADALSYLISLIGIGLIRTSLQDPPGERAGESRTVELLAGLRWVWAQSPLRSLLLWFVGLGMVFSSIGLVVLILARSIGANSTQLGLMFTLTAGGGLIGALATPQLLRRVSPQKLVLSFAWTAALATLLLLIAHSPYTMGLIGAVTFLLVPAVNTIAFKYVAERAPDHLQGRVTSAAIQLAGLGTPIAPALAGILIGTIGPRPAVAAYAATLLGLALVATAQRGFALPPERSTGVVSRSDRRDEPG